MCGLAIVCIGDDGLDRWEKNETFSQGYCFSRYVFQEEIPYPAL